MILKVDVIIICGFVLYLCIFTDGTMFFFFVVVVVALLDVPIVLVASCVVSVKSVTS